MVVNNLYEADLPANVRTASYKEKFYPVAGLDKACTDKVNQYLASGTKKMFTNSMDAALVERADNLKEYLVDCKVDDNPVVITWGPNSDQNILSQKTLDLVKEFCKESSEYNPVIYRTASTPEAQARIMYNLLEDKEEGGETVCRNMYGSNGDLVIDVWKLNQSKTQSEIKSLMESKINEIGPEKVSKHCGDFSVRNTFDIGPTSITNETNFKKIVNQYVTNKKIEKFLNPDQYDPAFHIQILQ